MLAEHESGERISTGVVELDEILNGGLLANRAYLIRGGPGSGKTTLGAHFLAAGVAKGEACLFINMGESESQIRANAAGIGCDIDAVTFLDLGPTSDFFREIQTYDIFTPAEVEREPTTHRIVEQIESLHPQRIFVDAMTQFRYYTQDAFQFRRQMVSFLRFLIEQGATVVFTSEENNVGQDHDLQIMSDGVINLTNDAAERFISVTKFRGSGYRAGKHSLRLTEQGMRIYPRLMPVAYNANFIDDVLSSGISSLDALLNGGLERTMVTILSGPTGVGKTTLGLQFLRTAAGYGHRSALYSFEEAPESLVARSRAVNISIQDMVDKDMLLIQQVDPLRYSADEFAHLVHQDVRKNDTRIVMLDSIAGYRLSLRGDDMVAHLHAFCKYFQSLGVTVILINETETITGEFKVTENGISYIADNILFLRYLEMQGELRRVVGVLKKRVSEFEKTMREFEITPDGLKVGKPLNDLRGILSGIPEIKAE